MGLLDDAIREHLDLKRRRGADPSEIAKEETEALGPVRREAAADAGAVADTPEASIADDELGPYADDDVAPAASGSSAFYDNDAPAPEPAREPSYAEPPASDYEHLRPRPAEPPQTHPDPYAEREDESTTPPHGDPLAHQQTREFSATELGDALGHEDDVAPAPPEAEGSDEDDDDEDVLEETPDFLQETPEHDRLWFEQKPPKDFDF